MKHVFEDFIVDTSTREVMQNGAPLAVEPKVFDVLVYLIENNDRVISKDELTEAIWKGRFISDSAISSALKSVRRVLGDDGQEQKFVKTAHGRGFRFVAPVVQAARDPEPPATGPGIPDQDIRYCLSADGTRIAYALAGEGPPLVKTSHWLTHLEFDWESPIWTHVNTALMAQNQLLRFDARGHGLSEWKVEDFSFDRQVEDLEAVIDAAGLDTFPLIGISQAAAVSCAYVVRNPGRVTRLILLGGYDAGWRKLGGIKSIAMAEAAITLMKNGWGGGIAIQDLFTSTFMPDAPPEYKTLFSELQKKTTTGKSAAALLRAIGDVDVRELLPRVDVPTLVLHARNDKAVRFENGQALAAGIPGARFFPYSSENHILPETDPAWDRCAAMMREFLAENSV